MTPLGASGSNQVSSIDVEDMGVAVGGACSSGAEVIKYLYS